MAIPVEAVYLFFPVALVVLAATGSFLSTYLEQWAIKRHKNKTNQND